MKKLKEKMKENRALRITMIICRVLATLLLVGFIFVVYLQRFSDNKLSFFDYRMFTVISGSMEPKYKIGDVLIAKETESSEIKVGDTISYLGTKGNFTNKVITHEVIGIEKDALGKYQFRTKGLANIVEDPIVSEEQLYGVIVHKLILLSILYKIVGTNIGFFLCVIVPIMSITVYEIMVIMLNKEDRRRTQ